MEPLEEVVEEEVEEEEEETVRAARCFWQVT